MLVLAGQSVFGIKQGQVEWGFEGKMVNRHWGTRLSLGLELQKARYVAPDDRWCTLRANDIQDLL